MTYPETFGSCVGERVGDSCHARGYFGPGEQVVTVVKIIAQNRVIGASMPRPGTQGRAPVVPLFPGRGNKLLDGLSRWDRT